MASRDSLVCLFVEFLKLKLKEELLHSNYISGANFVCIYLKSAYSVIAIIYLRPCLLTIAVSAGTLYSGTMSVVT